MMNFNSFKEEVREKLLNYLPSDYSKLCPILIKVNKINKEVDSLTFSGDGITNMNAFHLFIRLDNFYEDYLQTDDFEQVMHKLSNILLQAENSIENDDILEAVLNKVHRDDVVLMLINTAANRDFLTTVPHKEFLDLSVIYKIILNNTAILAGNNNGLMTCVVNYGNMEALGLSSLTEDELFSLAIENTKRILPAEIVPIEEILRRTLKNNGCHENLIESMLQDVPCPEDKNSKMWVALNQTKVNGAAIMLYPNVWEELAETLKDDLFVIPSSIHELIVLTATAPDSDEFDNDNAIILRKDSAEIANIVCNTNAGQVSVEERLSNQVYFYDRVKKKFSIASSSPEDIA